MQSTRFSHPPIAHAPTATPPEQIRFLRRVYGLFLGGLVCATLGALTALYAGAVSAKTSVVLADRVIAVPPFVAWFEEHWIAATLLYLVAFFAMRAIRFVPTVNAIALFGYTFVSGLYVAPLLFVATSLGNVGATWTPNPVRDAFLLAVAAFGGLTTYVELTRRDFSYLRGFLAAGLFALLAAMVLGMFVGGNALQLAIACAGALLFSGYVLYDTSRILHAKERTDPVGAAVSLYLDFLNLFPSLLRLFMSSNRRR